MELGRGLTCIRLIVDAPKFEARVQTVTTYSSSYPKCHVMLQCSPLLLSADCQLIVSGCASLPLFWRLTVAYAGGGDGMGNGCKGGGVEMAGLQLLGASRNPLSDDVDRIEAGPYMLYKVLSDANSNPGLLTIFTRNASGVARLVLPSKSACRASLLDIKEHSMITQLAL